MKNWLNGFLIVLMMTTNSAGQSVALKQGESAPFSGVLLDNNTANASRNTSIQIDGLTKMNDLLVKINDLHKKNSDIDAEKITILTKQNDSLAKDLQSSQEFHTWEKIAYIGLGVLAVSLGGLVVSKISK